MFSDIAPSGWLISCATEAVAASTLISRLSRSRRCKMNALASRSLSINVSESSAINTTFETTKGIKRFA